MIVMPHVHCTDMYAQLSMCAVSLTPALINATGIKELRCLFCEGSH